MVKLHFRRVPPVSEEEVIELDVGEDLNFSLISYQLQTRIQENGPFRFVFKGAIVPHYKQVKDLEIQPEDVIFFLRENAATPTTPAQPMSQGNFMSDMMDSPMMNMVLENPALLSMIMESNPTIQNMRRRSPELNALFQDPTVRLYPALLHHPLQ